MGSYIRVPYSKCVQGVDFFLCLEKFDMVTHCDKVVNTKLCKWNPWWWVFSA